MRKSTRDTPAGGGAGRPGFARSYGVELLYERAPLLLPEALLAAVRERLPATELVSDGGDTPETRRGTVV